MPHASLLVTLGIPAHAFVAAALFVLAHARVEAPPAARHRATLLALGGVVLWLGATGALAALGVMARFDARPPPFVLLAVACLALGLAVGLSPAGARLARGVPLAALVGAQALRFPLELVMHAAAGEGVMPPQMTFTGLNFDIVTGALALPLAVAIARGRAPRALVRAWNLLGLGTLAAVVTIAVASTPLLHAFGTEPAYVNTWVAYFPFVWLPAGPVVFALAGHVVVARALRATAVP